MKKMSKNIFLFICGILVAFTIDVTAETLIDSGVVSYSNSATSQTTVDGALNELFSAVEIGKQIGDINKISSIGDGTITGALSSQQTQINEQNATLTQSLTPVTYTLVPFQPEINYHVSNCKGIHGVCMFTADFSIPSGDVLYGDGRAYLSGLPVPWTVNGLPVIFSCIYRNTASGATLNGYCSINHLGQLTLASSSEAAPFNEGIKYTKEYNEVRVSGVYSCNQ